jgi:hypothetical protein
MKKSGTVIAASTSAQYGDLLAAVERGNATLIGEAIDEDGVKRVAVQLGKKRNPTIGISREFFTTVLKDYEDWRIKWWREGIQNAVDAGATKIHCEISEESEFWRVSITDNGGGMTEEVLLDKFLMLGGSSKVGVAGMSGGFGKAKELLILPWLQWSVHTRDRVVVGHGVDYEVSDAKYIKGTTVEVLMPSDEHTHAAAAVAFIMRCYLPDVSFTVKQTTEAEGAVNFQPKAALKAKTLIESVPGVDLYFTKTSYVSSQMIIRVNGLFMFNSYVGLIEGKQIIAEITAPSIEVLTANRDGFRNRSVSQAVNTLTERVIKDVRSALRDKAGLVRKKYKGAMFQAERARAEALSQIGPIQPAHEGKTDLPDVAIQDISEIADQYSRQESNVPNQSLAQNLLSSMEFAGAHHVAEAVRQLVWSPAFYLINEIEDYKIPAKFKPETMKPQVTKLVRTWTELCRYVLMQLGNFREFGVGLVFSSSSAAQYLNEDDEHWLLLNPFKDRHEETVWHPSNANDLKWLYAAAVHECTHLADGISYHDEDFAAALTMNMAKTADGFRHVRKIVNSIKMRDAITLTKNPSLKARLLR